MSKLTAAQLSLIKKGLATPEDFGAQGSEALSPETTNAITANLSPQQKSLIAKGLASPEDFTQREAASPAEDPENAARLAAYQQDAADWRGEGFGLVDTLTNLPAAVVAGRRAADTTAAEMQRNLVGRQFAPGMTEDNLVDAGLNTIGAIYDAATTDRTFSESLLDRAVTSRDELADARRRQAEAQQDVEALADRSTTLRTVADAAGSAPESVLSALGGIGGGAAGAVGGPTGIAAGAIVGSAAGSIPMARKAFYAAWDEAFKVARAGGMSEEDAAALADEQAFEQAATEFGVEAVTGAVGGGVGKLFGKVGGNLLRRTAIVGGGRVALEAGSEAITPYAQNAVRAGSAAVEGDERQARVIDSMVKEWNDPTLREEATRGLLAGGLGAGLIIAPTTAIEQAGQIRAEKADALRKKEAAELKADVEAIARSLGTPDAGRLAQTFSAGVDKATELDPLAGIEVDQLDVANESFQDTRFDRATQTIDNTLNLLDQSASNADTSRPMRLQNEERKAAVAEIDALRTYIKSVAPLAEAKALGRNERGNLKRAIDRLNFLEAQEQGRKDAGTAKEIRSRLANAPDAELLTVAGELDPSQNFTDITGPDLSRLSTPAPVPAKAPRAAANNALGVTQSAVQQGINEGRKQADKDAAKARAEEQNRPLQELEQRAANQQAFVRDYVRSNPTATDEEVQNALSTWEQTTQQLTATTPQVSPQTSLEARAAAALEASRNNTEKKARDDARKTENKAIADAIKAGITDPKAIAERVLAARQTAPAPATTTTATDTKQETLSFDPEAFLTERQTGRVPTSNNTRASMGNPEFEELLRQFEANEAAAVSSNVRDFNITDIAGGDNVHKRANIEGGVRGLMNTVATTEGTRETPVKGMLARRLAPLMEMLGVKVEFRDSPIYLNGDKSNGSAAGLWVPGENKILVYSGMDETSTNEFVLHEGVHSVLQGVYKDAAKFGEAGVKAKQAIDDGIAALEVARNDGRLAAAIEKVAANSPPSQRQATKDFLNMLLMSKAEGVIFRPDGTVEPDEFIAYGSTNRDVQNVFKEIKTGKRVGVSIWDKFKQAVRSILNFSGDDTVLDRVMEGTEGLISAAENNQAQTKRSADANRRDAVESLISRDRAMFAGINALKAPLDQVVQAEVMKSKGRSPEYIWRETGWWEGTDGEWRFEISDKSASINMDKLKEIEHDGSFLVEPKQTTLGEVLNHPKLFANYPQLKDIRVTFKPAALDAFKSYQGWFNSKDMLLNITPYAKNPLSTMLHEIQHAVQAAENFAAGGNENSVVNTLTDQEIRDKFAGLLDDVSTKYQATNKALAAIEDLLYNVDATKELENTLLDAIAANSRLQDYYNTPVIERLQSGQSVDRLSAIRDAGKDAITRLVTNLLAPVNEAITAATGNKWETISLGNIDLTAYETEFSKADDAVSNFLSRLSAKKKDMERLGLKQLKEIESLQQSDPRKAVAKAYGYDLYHALAGEVEARNVQKRADMEEDALRNKTPGETEDVPRDRQIVAFLAEDEKQASLDRAARQRPQTQTASTEEQLLEGRGEGALAGEDSGVERALQTVERSGNVGAFAVNALVRKDARIPVTMREETEAASNRNQAKVLEAMAMVRKMNALVRGNRGSLSTAAALNEFGADFNTLNKLRQKIRDKGPDPAVEKQITDLQEQMKFRWGEAYSILERAQSQIDEQSLVLMEEIIKAAPIGRDGKRQLTQEQIRQLNAIKANLGMYVSREFANNSANLREEHIKTFSDDSSPRVASAKREARKYLREKSLNIPEDPAVLMRQSIDSLRDLASVWVADMPTASKEDIVAALMEVRNDPDLYNEETLDAMVEKELNAIIEGSDASVTNRRYQSKAIDDRILKEREFVPQELLTVMGEVNNAGLQLLTTLHRQSMLIENMKAYAGMYDKLKGRAVFDNAATAPRNFVQLKGNYGKMTGKFVHPNVAEVLGRSETLKEDFTKAFSDPAQLSNAIFTAAGKVSMGAKAVTLLPNLLAWTMNLYGSIMLPVATGSVRSIPKMPKALMTAMIKMPGVWARKDISPDVLEVFRRGLEDSGHVAEITSESLRIAAETFRAPPGRVQSFLEGTSGAVGATMRLAFDMYAAMDLWSKFAIYYGEVDFLTSLNKELPAAERMSEESIRRVAAEWTKEVTPSYERTIPAANALERVGLGFFMRYNAEVWRNSVNNLSRVNKEFALARSFAERGLDRASMKLNERATTRLIGATVATISYSTVAGIAGSTMASALRAAFGLEDEEDDEVAQLVAEAAKQDNSFLAQKPLVVVGKDSAGWMVFDASRPLPQAPFQQTVHSLFSAMTGGEEDFSDVAEQLYGNFVSLSPPVTYIMNYGGYRDRKPIWVKEDGPVKRWMAENNIPDDGMIAKTMQALNILTPAQFDNALIDKEQPLATWFGTPPSRLDTTKMLQSYSINEELRAQRDLLVTDLKQPATLADEEEIKAIAARSIAVDLRRFQSVTARIRLARKSGMTDRDIVKTLEGTLGDRGSGLTSEDIRLMMNGNFMPSTLSQRTLDAAMRDLMNREGANREDIRRKFAVLRTELNTLRAAVKNGEFNPEE